MSGYRPHPPPQSLLVGYDPVRDLPADHLARLVEAVVEHSVQPPTKRTDKGGQPAYDPRLCLKVLIYGYCTGVTSTRRLEQNCRESLPYLFLTRGDAPSYRTLADARVKDKENLILAWEGLFAIAAESGLSRLGKIVIDSTKIRADVSSASIVSRVEFDAVRAELERCLAEALAADAAESETAFPTQLEKETPRPEQMRDILRRVRQQRRQAAKAADAPAATPVSRPAEADPAALTLPLEDLPPAETPPTAPAEPLDPAKIPKPLRHLATAVLALHAATAAGLSHVSLTDPDARMMRGGVERRTKPCHSWEVAVDNGVIVAAETTQCAHDHERLTAMIAAAGAQEPDGVKSATADSGYFSGDAVGKLCREGMDLCVPDPNTAGDLHRGQPIGTIRAKSQGKVPFEYDAAANVFRCPEGNTLSLNQVRQKNGQQVAVYRAERACTGCPRAENCLVRANTKHRTLQRGEYESELAAERERFRQPEHQARYWARGPAIETVFGFLRGSLGYRRWSVRGKKRVAAEGILYALSYQCRKIAAQLQQIS
jgi:transposase